MKEEEVKGLSKAMQMCCSTQVGVMDTSFLCESVAVLAPEEPITVSSELSVREVMLLLRENRVGCVLVENPDHSIAGIFSERDFVLKVFDKPGAESEPVSTFMTKDPVCVSATDTIAFSLSLMSQGGFRHLPVLDDSGFVVGLVSVKNFVDRVSEKLMNDLLEF